MSVARLLVESMPVDQLMTQLDEAGLESFQDWKAGSTRWFVVPDELSITVTVEEVEILSRIGHNQRHPRVRHSASQPTQERKP